RQPQRADRPGADRTGARGLNDAMRTNRPNPLAGTRTVGRAYDGLANLLGAINSNLPCPRPGLRSRVFRLLPTTLVVVVVGVLAAACGGTSTGTNKTTSNVPPFDQPGCGIVDAEIAQQVLRTDSI